MPVSKGEAEKYMILQVDVCFTKFPKNLTQAESKIESILKTVDYFYITKYRTRSSISKIVKRTMIDHIKDSIRSLGYEVEMMEKTYRKMRVLPGRLGGRPRGYACLKCGHEEEYKKSMSEHMKGCYKDE